MSNVKNAGRSAAKGSWAAGGTVFAATVMIMIGVFQILMGISAIASDSFLVIRGSYTYNVDVTGWGWIHLGLGVLIVLTGLGIFSGATWAKVAGIVLAVLSAVDNFLFLPYYPIWSMLLVALDVFVIWALAYSLHTASAGVDDLMGSDRMAYADQQAGQRWSTNAAAGYGPADPEAAGRMSDMNDPAGARHAAGAPSEHAHAGMPAGGQQPGGGMPGGMPPGTGQPPSGQGR